MDAIRDLIDAEIEAAQYDSKHPLSFEKAKRGFSVSKGKLPSDKESYYSELDMAAGGVSALVNNRKMRSAVQRRLPSRVTGDVDPNARLSDRFAAGGGTNKTPKGDLEVYDPKNPQDRRGISMKKGGGSQLASAEPGEMGGTYKVGAKTYAQRFAGDRTREERDEIRRDIENQAGRAGRMMQRMKTGSTLNTARRISGQRMVDRLHDKYPQLTRIISQISTSGSDKFRGRNAPGTAGVVLTGGAKKTEPFSKESERQTSRLPRVAKPKGANRPGNLKIDNK
jgi:hypothetical protein